MRYCCSQCEKSNPCNAKRIADTGIERYDMRMEWWWTPCSTMEPDDFGDYVLWDDVVALLRPKAKK